MYSHGAWHLPSTVCTGIYKYVLVHTTPCNDIPSMYMYRPVHTNTYLHKLVYTSTYQYVLVHTGIFWFLQVCTVIKSDYSTHGFVVSTATLSCSHLLLTMQVWRKEIPFPVQKTRNFFNPGLMQQIWKRQ